MKSKTIWDNFWEKEIGIVHNLVTFVRKIYFSRRFAGFCIKNGSKGIVLEAGSGTAQSSLILSKKNKIFCLDFSSNALKIAKNNAIRENKKINLIVGNVHEMPFKSNAFDMVWSTGLLEHLKDPVYVLDEMRRITKPSGKVMALVPYKFGPLSVLRVIMKWLGRKWIWEDEIPPRRAEIEKMFLKAKLTNIKVKFMFDTFLMFIGAVGIKSES